jgi:hypothetical protein
LGLLQAIFGEKNVFIIIFIFNYLKNVFEKLHFVCLYFFLAWSFFDEHIFCSNVPKKARKKPKKPQKIKKA